MIEKKYAELNSMQDLESITKVAIEQNKSLSLMIEMPNFPKPETITNPVENLEMKLDYYKKTYGEDLEHKHAKGIKIIGYTL